MTAERAMQIRYEFRQEDSFYPKHLYPKMTPEERKEVIKFWNTLPGYTCMDDALRRIEEELNG